MCDGKRTDHQGSLAERVIYVPNVFVRISKKAIRQASIELQIIKNVSGILQEKFFKCILSSFSNARFQSKLHVIIFYGVASVSPMSRDLRNLRQRIFSAFATINCVTLK